MRISDWSSDVCSSDLMAKPSDMLAELQGRLPIRVELSALTRDDFKRILTEPENSLIRQYKALLETEEVTLDFADEAIDALATLSAEINSSVENIGARRLHTVLRSEEHTSELQSLMRISYAVFCLKKKK